MRIDLLLIVFLWVRLAIADALTEFVDEIERDFPLRTVGQLQITNMRGDISVEGWALDKIRLKAKRKVMAENPAEAKKLFGAMDFRFQTSGNDIEVSAEYGRGLEIQERLRERKNPRTQMSMIVYAPSRLNLRIWATDGKVSVKSWTAPVDIRTASGPIRIENLKSESISILCPSCPIDVKSVWSSVRCMGGGGEVKLTDVSGSQIYVESAQGGVRLQNISGDQLYVSKTGAIHGKNLRGHIEFHTQHAPVEILDGRGFLSGRTETGSVSAEMKEWEFRDKALIESVSGSVSLSLPARFSGEVDLWSLHGKAEVEFPLTRSPIFGAVGPEPISHLLGKIGNGEEILKVFSEKGDIRISRLN